jgi:hypothetical protein
MSTKPLPLVIIECTEFSELIDLFTYACDELYNVDTLLTSADLNIVGIDAEEAIRAFNLLQRCPIYESVWETFHSTSINGNVYILLVPTEDDFRFSFIDDKANVSDERVSLMVKAAKQYTFNEFKNAHIPNIDSPRYDLFKLHCNSVRICHNILRTDTILRNYDEYGNDMLANALAELSIIQASIHKHTAGMTKLYKKLRQETT